MQESQQLQLGNQRDVSDLMDDEVRVCDTCGSVGLDSKLIVCHKCHDGAEHIYCMRVDEMSELTANKELRKDWICQECMLREGTNKLVQDEVEVAASRKKGHLSESSTNCESSKGSKLKSRSSCPGTSGEIGAQLSVKRDRVSIKKLKIKSVNEIVYSVPERSSGETLFSGPSFCNIEAVESSGQLDYRLQASNHNTHEDPNYSNGKMKNESQQGEQPTKAATARSMYQLCTDLAYDERTHLRDLVQVEAAILSERVIVPEANHTWLGKFQIHSNEGIGRTWDGIQAHLSNCTSHKVLEVVDRLPKIIILEELPRLRIWPPQFMGSQVTEENIALYFFAHEQDSYRCYEQLVDYMIEHDLALKGNLDGVELLIFPSTILPEKSWRWNQMLFIWGVFRGRKVNNSTTTPTLNSLKLGNGDAAKSLPFDLNAYPQDGDDMAIVDKIPEFDSGPSGDRVLVVGENSNSKGGEANAERADAIIDVNVSLWPESETPENGSIGIEDSSVEAPSTSLSLAPPLDPTDWKLVDALIFLSKS